MQIRKPFNRVALMMLRILKRKPVHELLKNDSPRSLLLVLEDLVDPVPEL